MQPFEFVVILVSIIVGLGITQILAGVVRLMRGELEGYWIHSVWILNVSLLLLGYARSQFAAESKTDWIFLNLVGRMTPHILLYLVASLLFPAREAARFASFPHTLRAVKCLQPVDPESKSGDMHVRLCCYYAARTAAFQVGGPQHICMLGGGSPM